MLKMNFMTGHLPREVYFPREEQVAGKQVIESNTGECREQTRHKYYSTNSNVISDVRFIWAGNPCTGHSLDHSAYGQWLVSILCGWKRGKKTLCSIPSETSYHESDIMILRWEKIPYDCMKAVIIMIDQQYCISMQWAYLTIVIIDVVSPPVPATVGIGNSFDGLRVQHDDIVQLSNLIVACSCGKNVAQLLPERLE